MARSPSSVTVRAEPELEIGELDGDPAYLFSEGGESDPSAILIIGCWRGWFRERREFIGCMPKDVAAVIASEGVFHVIAPRLARIYSKNGHLNVYFQVTCSREGAKAFKAVAAIPRVQ